MMNDAEHQATRLRLDTDGNIDEDLLCLKCDYNLRGLDPNRRCPECDMAVGRSIHGDMLRFCDPAWVERLASGMDWIRLGVILGLTAFILILALVATTSAPRAAMASVSGLVAGAVVATIGFILVIGFWKATSPEPDRPSRQRVLDARVLARYCTEGGLLLALVGGLCLVPDSQLTVALWLIVVATGAGAIGSVCLLVYAIGIARRVPSTALASETRIVVSGIAFTTALPLLVSVLSRVTGGPAAVGSLECMLIPSMVGALIFWAWAAALIDRYRGALRITAQEARATWARPPDFGDDGSDRDGTRSPSGRS